MQHGRRQPSTARAVRRTVQPAAVSSSAGEGLGAVRVRLVVTTPARRRGWCPPRLVPVGPCCRPAGVVLTSHATPSVRWLVGPGDGVDPVLGDQWQAGRDGPPGRPFLQRVDQPCQPRGTRRHQGCGSPRLGSPRSQGEWRESWRPSGQGASSELRLSACATSILRALLGLGTPPVRVGCSCRASGGWRPAPPNRSDPVWDHDTTAATMSRWSRASTWSSHALAGPGGASGAAWCVCARLWRTRQPRTFTEKVRYKMLRDHRPLMVTFADKAAVRGHVAAVVGRARTCRAPSTCSTTPPTSRESTLPDVVRPQADPRQRRGGHRLALRARGRPAARPAVGLGLPARPTRGTLQPPTWPRSPGPG